MAYNGGSLEGRGASTEGAKKKNKNKLHLQLSVAYIVPECGSPVALRRGSGGVSKGAGSGDPSSGLISDIDEVNEIRGHVSSLGHGFMSCDIGGNDSTCLTMV